MCRAVKCQQCGKTTWAGCGAHVQQVMGAVPESERCRCDQQSKDSKSSDGKSARSLASLLGFK